jgi:hypothetical protein
MDTHKLEGLTNYHPGNITHHLTEPRVGDVFEKKTENRFQKNIIPSR